MLSVAPAGLTLAGTEAAAFSGAVATFTATDAGPFSATVGWGDGSSTSGTVSSAAGVYTVSGSHTYTDEGTSAVSVTIADASDSTTATAASSLTVNEADNLTPSPGQFMVPGIEGTRVNANVALFADSGYASNRAADFTSTIDWGDGTTAAGTVTGPATTALDMLSQPGDWVGGGATYHFTSATGAFSVTTSAKDNYLTFNYFQPNYSQWWTVEFAAPNGAALVPGEYDNATRAAFHAPNQPGLEISGDGRGSNTLTGDFVITQAVYDYSGNVLSFDATFVQHSEGAAPALTGEIKYNASGGAFTVSGSHTYADDGTYKVTATLTDGAPGGASATTTATANIARALAISPSSSTLTATEGVTASPVVGLITNAVTPEPSSNYTALIDWGDGTSTTGTIAGAAGAYTVSGSHAYAEEGDYTMTVSAREVSAPAAPPQSVMLVVDVADGDLLVGSAAPIAATEGSVFTGATLATFTDAGYSDNNPADFTATIDWGDGSTILGSVSTAGDGSYTVSSSHAYGEEGSYVVNIVLTDGKPGTAIATATTTATVVENNALAAGPTTTIAASVGTAFSGTVATFVGGGDTIDLPSEFTSSIDWGDGTTSSGTATAATTTSLDMSFQPSVSTGAGAVYDFTTQTGNFSVGPAANDQQIEFSYRDSTHFWDVELVAPNGSTLVPGSYDNAARAGFQPASQPGLDVSGDGWGSNTLTGSFIISQAVYDASGKVLHFDATFVQHSEISGPTLTGEIKYNALTGMLTVGGSHTYGAGGVYMVTTTLAENGSGPPTATASATAIVVNFLTLSPAVSTLATTEGTTASAIVALLSDPIATEAASDFAATIDWDDGTTTTGTVTGAAGAYSVAGSHAYTDEGTYLVTVSAQEIGAPSGPPATTTFVAHVAEGDVLLGSADSITATEGAQFADAELATFHDVGFLSNLARFVATIEWGDGSISPAMISASADGSFTVSGSHKYAEEGLYAVAITLADQAPGVAVATANTTATVTEADALLPGSGITASSVEGQAWSGTVATFTDTGYSGNSTATFAATIDWGDGATTTGTVTMQASGSYSVSGRHVYTDEGTFHVIVTVAEAAPGTALGTAAATALVADADTLDATGLTVSATEGNSFTSAVATFDTDDAANPAGDFTATIDWGDGTVSMGTISGSAGTFTVSGSHDYADEGTQTALVVVHDDTTNSAQVDTLATIGVADAPLLLISATIAATAGSGISGLVANFTDAGPAAAASDYTAVIDWGDGVTTSGAVAADGGPGFQVTGTHDYVQPPSQPVTLTMSNREGSKLVEQLTGADLRVATGAALSNATVASFTDGDSSAQTSAFDAVIDWGDGSISAGTVSASAGVFRVTGSHRYATLGDYLVSVDVSSGQASFALSGHALAETPNRLYVMAVYEDVLGRAVDAGGLDYWSRLLDRGAAVSSVAEAIAHSAEYYANFVVKPAFLKLLGRAADDAGLAYWTRQMQQGLSDQQLEAELGASDEFYAKAENFDPASDADDTTIAELDHDADWINAVYTLLLGRPVDAAGEKFWSTQLNAGISRGQVALQIADSAENDAQLIHADYFHYLGRAADPDGLNFWLGQFSEGKANEDVIAGFTGSPEYYKVQT